MSRETPHQKILGRSVLPEVLFEEDLALVLSIPQPLARAVMVSGRLGPFLFVGGRPAVLKRTFLGVLEHLGKAGKPSGKELLP
jgi:hypothetical protein